MGGGGVGVTEAREKGFPGIEGGGGTAGGTAMVWMEVIYRRGRGWRRRRRYGTANGSKWEDMAWVVEWVRLCLPVVAFWRSGCCPTLRQF